MIERDDALLNDLLDGRLSDDEAAALRARLDTEPALRERFEELQRVQSFVREQGQAAFADADVPDGFLEGVHARIARHVSGAADPTSSGPDAAPAPAAKPRGRLLRFMAVGYAAAAAVVLAVTVHWVVGRPDVQRGVELTDESAGPLEGDGVTKEAADGFGVKKLASEAMEKRAFGRLEKKKPGEFSAQPPESWDPNKPQPEGVRFRGPHGAVPKDLREPSDEPPASRVKNDAAGARKKDGEMATGSRTAPGSAVPPSGGAGGIGTGGGAGAPKSRGRAQPASSPTAPSEERADPDAEKRTGAGERVYVLVASDAETAGAELDALLSRVRAAERNARAGSAKDRDRVDGAPAPSAPGSGGGGVADPDDATGHADAKKEPKSGFAQRPASRLFRLGPDELPELASLVASLNRGAEDKSKAHAEEEEADAPEEPLGKRRADGVVRMGREVTTTLTQDQWKRLEALVQSDITVRNVLGLQPPRPPGRRGGAPAKQPAEDRAGSDTTGKHREEGSDAVRVRLKILIVPE